MRVAQAVEQRLLHPVRAQHLAGVVHNISLVRKESFRADAPGQPLVEESFSDYRPIDGIQIPFRALRKAGPLVVERKVTEIKLNAPIEPALFSRPAS